MISDANDLFICEIVSVVIAVTLMLWSVYLNSSKPQLLAILLTNVTNILGTIINSDSRILRNLMNFGVCHRFSLSLCSEYSR